jgi:hypothetical protein
LRSTIRIRRPSVLADGAGGMSAGQSMLNTSLDGRRSG